MRTRPPPKALPACFGPNRQRRFCGWPPRQCAWLIVSFASWDADLRCLGPPLRARTSPGGSPSCSGSSIPSTRVVKGVTKAWELDLRYLGHFLCARASSIASLANSASLRCHLQRIPRHSGATRHYHCIFFFFCSSSFSLVFWVCFLFRLRSARVFGCLMWVLGLWVFLEGLFGISCGFGGFVGLGCLRGRFGCLMGASTIIWDLSFICVLGVVDA